MTRKEIEKALGFVFVRGLSNYNNHPVFETSSGVLIGCVRHSDKLHKNEKNTAASLVKDDMGRRLWNYHETHTSAGVLRHGTKMIPEDDIIRVAQQ